MQKKSGWATWVRRSITVQVNATYCTSCRHREVSRVLLDHETDMELYDAVLVEVKYHATNTDLSLETGHDIQGVLVKEPGWVAEERRRCSRWMVVSHLTVDNRSETRDPC